MTGNDEHVTSALLRRAFAGWHDDDISFQVESYLAEGFVHQEEVGTKGRLVMRSIYQRSR